MATKLNIETASERNQNYRRVVATTKTMQVVLMYLRPGEEIGAEKHRDTTQFFRVESGSGSATVGGVNYRLKPGDALVVPPNTMHNIKSREGLHLYTIYSPPHHPADRVDRTRPEGG